MSIDKKAQLNDEYYRTPDVDKYKSDMFSIRETPREYNHTFEDDYTYNQKKAHIDDMIVEEMYADDEDNGEIFMTGVFKENQ